MDLLPVVVNVVVSVAVPPAPTVDAPTGVTDAGVPICAPPLKKVTVPVVPPVLLLLEVIVAVNVTGVAVVTPVLGLAASVAAVVACDTVTWSTTGGVMIGL
jgi:hypothetical protein